MLSQSKSQASKARVPREGGDPEVSRTERQLALIWIPAFAGNSAERKGMNPPTPASPLLPPEGEDLTPKIFPLWGKWREAPKGALFAFPVFLARAGA